jgi:VCBS repeat protein
MLPRALTCGLLRSLSSLTRMIALTGLLLVAKTWSAAAQSGWTRQWWTGAWGSDGPIFTGDLNGDGKADVFMWRNSTKTWMVNLSTGTGFDIQEWKGAWGSDGPIFVGDLNGDGKADVFMWRDSSKTWMVNLSTGTGFNIQEWQGARGSDGPIFVGDLNGDGKADVFMWRNSTKTWTVNLSTGAAFSMQEWKGAWGPDGPVFVGDLNGDGATDVFMWENSIKTWAVNLSTVPLKGFVDLHTHPLSTLGFGGKLIYGGVDVGSLLPADPDCNPRVRATSMEQALGHDKSTHGGHDFISNTCGDEIRKSVIHALQADNHAADPSDDSRGAPDFRDWPVWKDITHQKMWVDWIRRAHDAGLRVMVALAVNNKTLGDATAGPGDYATDDKSSADLQIAETKGFVGRHPDFMEIAYTSADLARIVRANKLAVVLGVEIDNIGNLHKVTPLTNAGISGEIDRLYAEGVRYIFPIHIIDNPFGGTAVYENAFNTSNYREAGHFWDLECADRSDDIDYLFEPSGFDLAVALVKATKLGIDIFRNPPTPPSCLNGHRNALGLIPGQGEFAIREMMRRGMLIDIDHMSQKSANQALDIAEAVPNGGYPLNSGHNGVRCPVSYLTHCFGSASERSLTSLQYRRIGNLHGMAGVGSANVDAYRWIKLYGEVVQVMGQTADVGHFVPAGFGTDTDGLALGMPPRAGSSVQYDASFPKSRLGTREWDYNTDGVAHYGMLADFLKDARTAPGGAALIDNYLMFGADYFYHTWETCEKQKAKVK